MESDFEAIYQEVVERYRRHLRGEEPMPDITSVPEELHTDLHQTFALLESITGVSDELVPPIDKVAARLGVRVPSTGSTRTLADIERSTTHDVTAADLLAELESLTGEANASRLGTCKDGGGVSLELVVEYRQLGVFVGVCLVDCSETALTTEATLRAAAQIFTHRTAYTAVALVGRGHDMPTAVVPPEDCQDALNPQIGYLPPSTNSPTLPFLTAMEGHLSYMEPSWEDVPSNLTLAGGLEVDKISKTAATKAVLAVASANTTIAEKKEALGSLGPQESRVLASFPSELIGRTMRPADLTREIDRLAGVGTS